MEVAKSQLLPTALGQAVSVKVRERCRHSKLTLSVKAVVGRAVVGRAVVGKAVVGSFGKAARK